MDIYRTHTLIYKDNCYDCRTPFILEEGEVYCIAVTVRKMVNGKVKDIFVGNIYDVEMPDIDAEFIGCPDSQEEIEEFEQLVQTHIDKFEDINS